MFLTLPNEICAHLMFWVFFVCLVFFKYNKKQTKRMPEVFNCYGIKRIFSLFQPVHMNTTKAFNVNIYNGIYLW